MLWPSAPEAPHISAVEYSGGVLFLRWTYGELFIDLSHSRMLHWQVLAIGRKGAPRGYSVDVSLSVPLGSAHPANVLLPWKLMQKVLPGEPERDASEPAPPSWRHLQRDSDGVHGAQQELVHAQRGQTGWAFLLLCFPSSAPFFLSAFTVGCRCSLLQSRPRPDPCTPSTPRPPR